LRRKNGGGDEKDEINFDGSGGIQKLGKLAESRQRLAQSIKDIRRIRFYFFLFIKKNNRLDVSLPEIFFEFF
jgi:hypothetical protein